MKYTDCPCSGKSLGRLVHPAVLAVLAHGEAHGYEVAQRLQGLRSFASQPADHGGIYRVLAQMQRDGYVSSRWEEPDAGPAKKVFSLTSSGRSCLGQWRRTLSSYRDDVDALLGFMGKRS